MVEKVKKKRKVLVTGSSGMLGTCLCRELEKDHKVTGLDIRTPEICKKESFEFIKCDIMDHARTRKHIKDAHPEVIVHAAAWTDVDGCEKEPESTIMINSRGTEAVRDAARSIDAAVIYISTDYVFDGKKRTPYTESDAPNPINIYGQSKLEGERSVAALPSFVIIRTSWLYGKHGKNFVDTILRKLREESELRVVNDQIGSPTYAKDFAKAIGILLDTISKDTRETFHVSNRGSVSWFDFTKSILEICKIEGFRLLPITSKEVKRLAVRPAYSVLDNAKYEERTGFKMRAWKEALKEYIYEEKKLQLT